MPERLLDPEGLSLVARLELVARRAVEGFLSGVHPSPYFGSSVEYADHRPYTPGDELRTLDWKLLAKTDKHYVKLYEEQTNTRCTILLDTSRSMAFSGDPDNGQMDKLTYGMFVSAALAYLALRQHDAAGLAMFDSRIRSFLPPRATAAHFRNMLGTMEQTTAGNDTGIGRVLHELAGRLPKRGIVIVVSDLIDDVPSIVDGLASLRHQRNEVIVFHTMDRAEREFPYERLTRFRDMEGTGSVITNPANVRRAYLRRLEQFLERVRHACLERDISYELAMTDQPYARMLSQYLTKRMHMSGK